jgi:hypothetical protein
VIGDKESLFELVRTEQLEGILGQSDAPRETPEYVASEVRSYQDARLK